MLVKKHKCFGQFKQSKACRLCEVKNTCRNTYYKETGQLESKLEDKFYSR